MIPGILIAGVVPDYKTAVGTVSSFAILYLVMSLFPGMPLLRFRANDNDAVSNCRNFLIVGDDNSSLFLSNISDDFYDLRSCRRVERRGRLIYDDDLFLSLDDNSE